MLRIYTRLLLPVMHLRTTFRLEPNEEMNHCCVYSGQKKEGSINLFKEGYS